MLSPVCPPGAACMSRTTYSPSRLHHPTTRSKPIAHTFEPLGLALCHEQAIIERDANRVKAGLLNEFYIFVSDVIVTISLPESPCLVLPDELIDHNLNQSRGIGGLEFKHITFRHQPVTEIDAS